MEHEETEETVSDFKLRVAECDWMGSTSFIVCRKRGNFGDIVDAILHGWEFGILLLAAGFTFDWRMPVMRSVAIGA